MTMSRVTTFFAAAGLALGAIAVTPQAGVAQAQASAPAVATSPAASPTAQADAPVLAGPRLAPRWEPAPVLMPGQTAEREVNAAVRRDTITVPVVTLLLGIIILILLID